MRPFPKLLPPLSRSRRSWSSQALRNCVTIAVYSASFPVPAKTICRSSRERRAFLEKSISPNFQLKESLTSLFMSPRCLYKRVFVFDHLVFSLRVDRGSSRGDLMIVTSCSRFFVSGVPDTSESLGHLAESTLLSRYSLR